MEEIFKGDGFMEGDGGVSIITTSVLFLFISEKLINGGDFIGLRFLQEIFFSILEDEFGVEELGIDIIRSNKSKTDDENFCRLSSRSSRFCGFNFLEEFIQNPDQGVIICGSEDLGDESTASSQDGGSEFQGSQDQFDLRESILAPIGTDVGGTIIQDDINLFTLDFFLDLNTGLIILYGREIYKSQATRSGNIFLESDTAWDRLDFVQIYTDFNTGDGHVSCSDLKPVEE